jgi:hypothetical protein
MPHMVGMPLEYHPMNMLVGRNLRQRVQNKTTPSHRDSLLNFEKKTKYCTNVCADNFVGNGNENDKEVGGHKADTSFLIWNILKT